MLSFLNQSFIFLLSFTLLACSGYNEVLKGDDYSVKYSVANDFYEKGMSTASKKNERRLKRGLPAVTKEGYLFKAINLYEQVYQRMPKTIEGEMSYLKIGKAYYSIKDYYMAGYYMSSYAQRFPYSQNTEETVFLSALCSVYNSPESSLDQNDTKVAINNVQQFIHAYPNSLLLDSCNKIIDMLRFKLEQKDYDAVKLYDRTMNYRAAVTSAKTFLEEFSRSGFRQEVAFLLVKNAYFLAKNSIESKKCERIEQAIESYRSFAIEFPQSPFLKQVDSYGGEIQQDFDIFCNGK